MKVFGKDVTAQKLLDVAKERLASRGLLPPSEQVEGVDEVIEAPVDAFAFAVETMAEHVDSTRGLPIETHRDGLQGRAVVLAKQLFRRAGQLFINEALSRQVVFNGQVLDGYAQLSAEVVRLRAKVATLEHQASQQTPAKPSLDVAKQQRSAPVRKRKPARSR